MEKIENQKKLLDLPVEVVAVYAAIAEKERKSVKACMESTLIDAAKAIKNNSSNKQ